MTVKKLTTIARYTGLSTDTKPTSVPVGSTFWEYNTRDMYITYDGTNWVVKDYGAGGDEGLEWVFGKPYLEAGGEGRAEWTRSTTAAVSDRVVWAAKLDAGTQSSWDDYAKVVIPVNEMAFTSLDSVRLWAKYTASTGIDMGVCVYIHKPTDFDQRVEISHTPYTNSAAGTRELNYPTEPPAAYYRFWYGTVTDTPDTCPTEGTGYTWAQFQADSVFSTWTIYKITLDYGYHTGDMVMNGCYVYQCLINGETIRLEPSIEEQINIAVDRKANALTTIPTWTFGQPELRDSGNGVAKWTKETTSPLNQKGTSGWLADLYGGVQTGGTSWAAVYIPVNEIPVPDFTEALWTYYMDAAEVYGVNIVIWVHDPDDNDLRAEITQSGSATGLEKANAWNAHEFDTSVAQMFYYGEISGTPDTCPTAGTLYTWDQFRGDSIFSQYTIYRISLEYGWYSTGTFTHAYVADVKLNGQVIPLIPPINELVLQTAPMTKTVQVTQALAAASAYSANDIMCSNATTGVQWIFTEIARHDGGSGRIVQAMIQSESENVTPRITLFVSNATFSTVDEDHAANTNPDPADLANYQGKIDMPVLESLGTTDSNSIATCSTYGNLPLYYTCATGADDLYIVAVTRDAFTQTPTDDMTITLTVEMF